MKFTENTLSVSDYVDCPKLKSSLDKWTWCRAQTLNILYKFDEYLNAPIEEKNIIYDKLYKKMLAGFEVLEAAGFSIF